VLHLPRAKNASTSVYTGRLTPICGWISTRFDEKRPAPTIVWRARITGTCTMRTHIHC